MCKIIFLDIDGVLNNRVNSLKFIGTGKTPIVDTTLLKIISSNINDVFVVITSSLRNRNDIKLSISKYLSNANLKLHKDWRTEYLKGNRIRGDEVNEWLSRHGEVTKFICIDDDSDFYEYQNLVRTNGNIGLTIYETILSIILLKDNIDISDNQDIEFIREYYNNFKNNYNKRYLQ